MRDVDAGCFRRAARTSLTTTLCLIALAVPGASRGAEARTVTITTNSDAVNGDVSTFQALVLNPGPDGISLREALLVTRNDPGQYGIRFGSALAGTTIRVGSSAGGTLPAFTTGGVSVDGDVDGDGRADVTLLNELAQGSRCGKCAFTVASSGNRLHALTLEGFPSGVVFHPLARDESGVLTHQSYANNVVSNLVLNDVQEAGITFVSGLGRSECVVPTNCHTHNTWLDTELVGNTIVGTTIRTRGIHFGLSGGDRLERLRIAGNTIATPGLGISLDMTSIGARLTGVTITGNSIRNTAGASVAGGTGISLVAGAGPGSKENLASDIQIADNAIEGTPLVAIRLSAGDNGANANTVETIRILRNRVDTKPAAGGAFMRFGIDIIAGDAASDFVDPDLRPIVYPDDNVVRDVEISANTLTEGSGVHVSAGCCGAARNLIQGMRIKNNEIRMALPFLTGVRVNAGASGLSFSKATSAGRVSDLSIDANVMTYPVGAGGAQLDEASIVLAGGSTANAGQIADASITRNRIEHAMNGFSIIGGLASGKVTPRGATPEMTENAILRAVVRENVVSYKHSGVVAVGGWGCGVDYASLRNAIRGLKIEGNTFTGENPGRTNGVEIIGGEACRDAVSDNRVEDASVSGNVIRANGVAIRVVGGRGPTATRNRVIRAVVGANRLERNNAGVQVVNNLAGGRANAIDVLGLLPTVRYAGEAVRRTAVRLKVVIDPRGSTTTYFVRYGRSRAKLRATTRRTISPGTGAKAITVRITGLRPGTTYRYRVVARSRSGTTVGRPAKFRTLRRARR